MFFKRIGWVLFSLFVFLLCSCNSGEEKQTIKTQNPSPDIPFIVSAPNIPYLDSTPNIPPIKPLLNSPSSRPAHVSPQNPSLNISSPAHSTNTFPQSHSPSFSNSPVPVSPQNSSHSVFLPEEPLSDKPFSAKLLPPPVQLTEKQKEEIGIVGVIQSNKAGIHFCNRSYLPRNSKAELKIQWSVNGQGKMAPIYVLENPTNNEKLAECFTTFLSRLEYPKSLKGDTTTLIQTFVFSWK